jgi:D-alanine-D-alanine ligase
MSMKRSVALIFGGEGCERDISIRSAKCIYEMIDKEKFSVLPVYISENGDWYAQREMPSGEIPRDIPTFPVRIGGKSGFLVKGHVGSVSVALPILHGECGEDGVIQGALEAAHIPYVGCDVVSGAVCFDKAYAKAVAASLGIQTARWISSDGRAREELCALAEEKIGYPMFIKPARRGSSIGAARVNTAEDFYPLYDAAAIHGRVIIEEYIQVAYEVECGFLSLDGEVLISPGGTIDTGGDLYDYDTKYRPESRIKASHGSPLTPERERIANMAKQLALALDMRHMGRLDFLVSRTGEIYFNEVNTIPGMTATSLYPGITEDMGLGRGEFINRLIDEVAK